MPASGKLPPGLLSVGFSHHSLPSSQWLIEAAPLPGHFRLWAEPLEAPQSPTGFRVTPPHPHAGHRELPLSGVLFDFQKDLCSNTDLET